MVGVVWVELVGFSSHIKTVKVQKGHYEEGTREQHIFTSSLDTAKSPLLGSVSPKMNQMTHISTDVGLIYNAGTYMYMYSEVFLPIHTLEICTHISALTS